jgi:hypothetical protein
MERKKKNRQRSKSGKKDETQTTYQEETPSVPVWPGRKHSKKEYVIKQTDEPENNPDNNDIPNETTTNETIQNELPSETQQNNTN